MGPIQRSAAAEGTQHVLEEASNISGLDLHTAANHNPMYMVRGREEHIARGIVWGVTGGIDSSSGLPCVHSLVARAIPPVRPLFGPIKYSIVCA